MSFANIKNHQDSTARPAISRRAVLLQRSCACGGGAAITGNCEECNKKRSLQRRAGSQAEPSAVPRIVHDVLRSSGKPLPGDTRDFMESRFGHDFSQVRVHTDATAAESARAVNAHAYTVGKEIIFGQGQFTPHTEKGQHLLAHELAHTLQQNTAGAPLTVSTDSLEVGRQSDPAEREADAVARSVLAGVAKPVSVSVKGEGAALRRDEDGGTEAGKEEEPPKEAGGEKEKPPAGPGGDVGTGAGTGTGSPTAAACAPKALLRADYLKESGTTTNDFGLTILSGTVSGPVVHTSKTAKGLVLDPTDAKMPPLASVYTGPDKFIEGEAFSIGEDVECTSGKKYPLQWTILPAGAQKIKEGELEHCRDFEHAFAISLRRYADVVNDLSAKKKVFSSQKAAEKYVTGLVGPEPDTWLDVYTCLSKKTKDRDTMQWHTPRPLKKPPRLDDDCKFARAIIHGASLPEVDPTKHPTPDVINGCGEGPPATKGAAAKSARPNPKTPAKTEGKIVAPGIAAAAGGDPGPTSEAIAVEVPRASSAARSTLRRAPAESADNEESAVRETPPSEVMPETSETAATETAAGLIVDDESAQVDPTQMKKSEFLAELKAAVCVAADAELARVGQSTESCPYLARAFARYSTYSAAKLERALRRYAPETAGVTTAHDYIGAVSARVARAVTVWATTGEVTGAPEELLQEMGGGGLFGGLMGGLFGGIGSVLSGLGGLFFKRRVAGQATGGLNASILDSQLGAGSPLDNSTRVPMERALGHDFSQVRVHTDAAAANLSSYLNARAFTIGTKVAFAAGEYQPGTLFGDALIAHELAHVVQQNNARTEDFRDAARSEDSAVEMDADMSAIGAVSATHLGRRSAANIARNSLPRLRSGLRLQRCPSSQQKRPTLPTRQVTIGQVGSNRCSPEERQSMEKVNLCCTPKMVGEIQTILGQAIPAVANARSRLESPKDVRDQLWNNFRVKPDDETSIAKIRMTLQNVENSMNSSNRTYVCSDSTDPACTGERGPISARTLPTCAPTAHIYIRLCNTYPATDDQAKQPFLPESHWVRTMVHEHAHAGCSGSGDMLPVGTEFYKNRDPYPRKQSNDNIKNADCYAWFVMDSK